MTEAEVIAQELEGFAKDHPIVFISQAYTLEAAALIRDQAAKIERMSAALRHFYQGWHAPQSVLDKHAQALRDAGVSE